MSKPNASQIPSDEETRQFFARLFGGGMSDDEAAAWIQGVEDQKRQAAQGKRQAAQGKPTAAMQRLLADLEPLRASQPALVERIAQRARRNHYDDFIGCDLPKIELLRDAAALPSIFEATIQGKYDE